MSASQHRTTWIVVSAAPPAGHIHELLALLRQDAQFLVVATTPAAATWIDELRVREYTAWPVRSTQRAVDEPKTYPPPDLVVAVPLTFNTINKWAAGINDNAALGILNEALGDGVPIIAVPVAKSSLTAHPAFARNLDTLASAGVMLTATNAVTSGTAAGPFNWKVVLDAIATITSE